MEYNHAWINKMKSEVEEMITGVKTDSKHEKRMLEIEGTNVWNINVEGSLEIEMETGFEMFLLSLSEYTNESIDKMSTFRFYALQKLIKEKNNARSNN